MNNKQIILLGAIVLAIGLLVGGGIFLAAKRGAASPTPTPAPEPTPETVMEEPTETPQTTATPTIRPTKPITPTATKTPAPTATVGPTATITPTASPTAAPGVVNIEASVTPTTSAACTQKFDFSAKIYTNGSATVKYRWLRSDGANGAEQTITYDGAGIKTVTTDWTLSKNSGESYNGWQRIEILSGGSGVSNTADFTLTCP